jgi:hypothetical protein
MLVPPFLAERPSVVGKVWLARTRGRAIIPRWLDSASVKSPVTFCSCDVLLNDMGQLHRAAGMPDIVKLMRSMDRQ